MNRRSTSAWLGVLALTAIAMPAWAAGESIPPVTLGPGLAQTTLGLGVVLASIFGVAWLVRRLNPATRSSALIKIVATQALGQRERVVLVEVGEQWLLLGVAPGAVRTLQTLPKGTLPTPAPVPSFARILAAARTGRFS